MAVGKRLLAGVSGFFDQRVRAHPPSFAKSLGVGLLFFVAQFWGSLAVPEAEFVQYLQGRMADPARTRLLSFSFIWYQSLAQEIHDTWQRMPSNLLGVPVFALLIWLHAPLWKYFAGLIRSLSDRLHPRFVVAALVGTDTRRDREVGQSY